MININLLPPEIKLNIKRAKQSANVFSICLVIVLLVGVLGIILSQVKLSLFQPQLDEIKSQITTSQKDLASFKDLEEKAIFLNERAKLASQIEAQRASWSQILQDLINSVPTDVQFQNLTADASKTPNFVLQGKTTSEREIIKFKEKLDNSPFFKDAAFKSSTKSGGENNNQIDFSLEFSLEKKSVSSDTTTDTKTKGVK